MSKELNDPRKAQVDDLRREKDHFQRGSELLQRSIDQLLGNLASHAGVTAGARSGDYPRPQAQCLATKAASRARPVAAATVLSATTVRGASAATVVATRMRRVVCRGLSPRAIEREGEEADKCKLMALPKPVADYRAWVHNTVDTVTSAAQVRMRPSNGWPASKAMACMSPNSWLCSVTSSHTT